MRKNISKHSETALYKLENRQINNEFHKKYCSGSKYFSAVIEKVRNSLLMHEMVVNLIKHMITAPKHLSKWFYRCERARNEKFLVFFCKKYLSGQIFLMKFFHILMNANQIISPNFVEIGGLIFHDTPY